MRQFGLRFILKSGAFINAGAMTEQKARETVQLFLSGEWKVRGISRIGDAQSPDGAWTVCLDEVAAVHTFEPEIPGGIPRQTNPSMYTHLGSGM